MKEKFFNVVRITGDGNCIQGAISYYLNKNENQHSYLTIIIFNYIKNNLANFYKFYYVEEVIYLLYKRRSKS